MFQMGYDFFGEGSAKNVIFMGPRQDPPYRWPVEMERDYYFKYIEDEDNEDNSKTIWVRSNINARISHVARAVAHYIEEKQGFQNAASEIKIVTFAGQECPSDSLWDKPDKSLFLLSKGPLSEELLEHKGYLWQCKNTKCGNASTVRQTILNKKGKGSCRHSSFWFEKQHGGKKYGHHQKANDSIVRPTHCPNGHLGTDEPATTSEPMQS